MRERNLERKLRDPAVREWLRALTPVQSIVRTTGLAFLPFIEIFTGSRISALRLITLLGDSPRTDNVERSRKE